MTQGISPPPPEANEEVAALIATLHATGQRLEELTGGEVDTVADREGHTFLLGRAQEQLRRRETAKQTAILNALPAHIALLDIHGLILSVNEAWRQFGSSSAVHGPGNRVGLNYLEICDSAEGEAAAEAHQIADGIRSVLSGQARSFSVEYACGTPTEQLWFLMTATPLADDRTHGAVVMHLNVTAERHAEASLRASELRFRQMADNVNDVFYLREADGSRMLYVSPAYEEIWGRSRESLYSNPASWAEAVHPEDRAATREKNKQGILAGRYEFEYRIVRPDGSIRWIETKGFPVPDDAGKTVRIAGVAEDITERKQAAEQLRNSEARFRSLTQLSSDWFWEQDAEHRFVRFSGGDHVDGWGPDQAKAIGVTRWELPTIEPLSDSWDAHKAVLEAHKPFRNFEYRRVLESGVMQYVAASGEPIFDAGGRFTGYRGVATDITKRKLDEGRIIRLNRVYAVLSGINTLIVRARDRDELFREACRIAVEDGQFRMVWIGVVDRSAMEVVPVACAGADAGLLDELRGRLSLQPDLPARYGPTGMAVNEKQAIVVNDAQADPRIHHKKALADRGVGSLAILPLLVAGEALAVFGLHAAEAGYFDETEMSLLRELAGNLSFALNHIEKEKKLKDSEERFRQMADNISDVFFLREADGSRMLYISQAYEKIWGRSRDSLYANPASWGEAIHPEDLASTREKSTHGSRAGRYDMEFRIVRPDGSIRWIETKGFPVPDEAGKTVRIAGVAEDITERKLADEVLGKRAAELERFHRLSVGRELQMVELKKQVNALATQAGQPAPYDLAFLGAKPKAG